MLHKKKSKQVYRYGNRKFYADGKYVTLNGAVEKIKKGAAVLNYIDKVDITHATLLSYLKASASMPELYARITEVAPLLHADLPRDIEVMTEVQKKVTND